MASGASRPLHRSASGPSPVSDVCKFRKRLAGMLDLPGGEHITKAALAAKLQVSEAALYRHFASKAKLFEALIDFIEHSVFTLSSDDPPSNLKPACCCCFPSKPSHWAATEPHP